MVHTPLDKNKHLSDQQVTSVGSQYFSPEASEHGNSLSRLVVLD